MKGDLSGTPERTVGVGWAVAGRVGRWVSSSSSAWHHVYRLVGAGRWKFRGCKVAKQPGFRCPIQCSNSFDSINIQTLGVF